MNSIGKWPLVGAFVLSTICGPAVAHHSFAMFDQNKLAEMKDVTVVQYRWSNPHVYIFVKKGDTVYTLEMGSVTSMAQSGWKFDSVKAGDRISVVMHPLRNGKPGGALKTATLANGKTLVSL